MLPPSPGADVGSQISTGFSALRELLAGLAAQMYLLAVGATQLHSTLTRRMSPHSKAAAPRGLSNKQGQEMLWGLGNPGWPPWVSAPCKPALSESDRAVTS